MSRQDDREWDAKGSLQRDRERPVYNLKESMLARCYIDILSLEKHSEAAQRLIKWKQPAGNVSRSCVPSVNECGN